MDVIVNGKSREIADAWSVSDLIDALGFGQRQVVVERNGEPVERSRYADVRLAPGDVLEIVRAVAGGAC